MISHTRGHYLGRIGPTCTLSTVSEPSADLAAENAALRERIAVAITEIEALRAEAAQRQTEIRALTAQLPERVSRRAVITAMVSEFRRRLTSVLVRRPSPQ